MNVMFLAENPQMFLEYARRLEERAVPFWTARTTNDFHRMMTQVKIDVVFADYNLMDFERFDVYKHISKSKGDLVFLFLNDPAGRGELLVQWEDRVQQHFPGKWTEELERLLRIVVDQQVLEECTCTPTKVQDLVAQVGVEEAVLSERESGEGIGGRTPQMPPIPSITTGAVWERQGERPRMAVFEHGSLREFMELHKKYKLGYQEYVLMNLFFRRLNQFVEVDEMMQTVGVTNDKKGHNAIYQYIYRIRLLLEKMERSEVQLIRVKKGCYSLVSLVP